MQALIIDAVRTPRGKGKPGGALSAIHPQNLLAGVLKELEHRVGFDPVVVEDVITGCAAAEGDHGDCIARLSVLAAGWPDSVPGVTLNRFCGSGQQAINYAAMMIDSGQADVVVASGVEMLSRSKPPARPTLDGGNPWLRQRYELVPQGVSADLIATVEDFSREELDGFAVESQRRAAVALAQGRFNRSMTTVLAPDGSVVLDTEELPRPSTAEDLARLSPSFTSLGTEAFNGYERSFDDMCLSTYPQAGKVRHVHHAGNSSGLADGASAVLLASPRAADAYGWTPRARVVSTAAGGTEPVIMLTGAAAAAQRCLQRAGLGAQDVDLFEVNEAFAAVVLHFMRNLEVDHARFNVNGGAIALGHPIGATGPILAATLLDELERSDQQTGLIAMCTGAGMGTATLIERC